jgi:AraC-like DNA-binding protein
MMNDEDHLHPVAVSQVMINFAQRYGVDRNTCLLGTGITEDVLLGGEGFVTRSQEMRLIENIMLALPDGAASGFELGLQYNLATFGVWGFALRTSKTLRDAMLIGARYLPLSTAYCAITAIDDGGDFGIQLDPDSIVPHLRQFLLERDMATAMNLIKELSLSGIAIKKLEFVGQPNVTSDYLEKQFGVIPIFDGKRNCITVTRADAELPFSSYDPELVRFLEDQCRIRMHRIETAGLDGKVRQRLLSDMGLATTLNEMARELALSPRSLRRKLEQERTSFREIVEDERKQLAIQLLKNTSMKLDELAAHLGYMDAGGFARAFRRWMNCSPSDYRESKSGGADEPNSIT